MASHHTLKILLYYFLFIPALHFGQQDEGTEKYYNWYDGQTGRENKQVYNGTAYIEKYRTINEKHKFFNSSRFLSGSVTYEGQPYYELELKYDLYEDNLLLNTANGKGAILSFNSDKITGFYIDSHKFIHPGQNHGKDQGISGFYEVLLESPFFILLKKNRKSMLKKLGNGQVYYEFKSDNENFLYYKGSYYPLNKKRDVRRIFPEFKKNINTYYTTSQSNSNEDVFLKSLLKNIELELSKEKNGSPE